MGQDLIKKLLVDCDILVENFKTGTLDKYGLGYKDLKSEFPRLNILFNNWFWSNWSVCMQGLVMMV